ncbi:MAG: hypothetical protein ACREDO_08800 [Methyloceanibacter sp.]
MEASRQFWAVRPTPRSSSHPPTRRSLLGRSPTSASANATRSWSALGASPVDIDELIRATGLETRKVHIVLLELDLAAARLAHLGVGCACQSPF